jgi:DNA-binding transcriptional LysR family regulator
VVTVKAVFTARDVTEAVRAGAVELGLPATARPLPETESANVALGQQRFVLLVPPGDPLAGRQSVTCEELSSRRLIVGQPGTGMRAYVDSLCEQGIAFSVAAEIEHRVALLPLVLAGVGLAVVTESWRDLARHAGAHVLDIEPATAPWTSAWSLAAGCRPPLLRLSWPSPRHPRTRPDGCCL